MNAYNYTIKDIENMSAANLADMADDLEARGIYDQTSGAEAASSEAAAQ